MNLRHLEFLRVVIESGGFGSAARAVGVSQAAITYAMRSLENELGFPLFIKAGRRKTPTERALLVSRDGLALKTAVLRMSKTPVVKRAKTKERLEVRVALAAAAGLIYGPLMHKTLLDCNPNCLLRVITGPAPDMLDQLQRNLLDLVIAPLPRKFRLTNLHRHVLYIGMPVIYARVNHPLAGAHSLAEIAQANWVVASRAGTPGNTIEEAFRVRNWSPPKIAVECVDFTILIRLIADSDLLGVISNPALVPDAEHMRIRPLPILEGLPRYEVCLFWAKNAGAPEREEVTRLIDALTKH